MAKQIDVPEGAVALVFFHDDEKLLSAVHHNFLEKADPDTEEKQALVSYLIRGIIEEVQEDVHYYVQSGVAAVKEDMRLDGISEVDEEEVQKPASIMSLKDMEPEGNA